MTLGEAVKNFGDAAKEQIVTSMKGLLKPLLKSFSQDVIQALKEAAAKTATPFDDMVVAAAEPTIDKMVDEALAKI